MSALAAEGLPAPATPTRCCWHSKTGTSPSYWLVLEASPTATWDDLDSFLRHIWVECCGHLSCFNHAGMTFAYDVDGAYEWAANPRSMAARLADTVAAGSRFSYEYDFGTTTELLGRVLGLVPTARTTGPMIEVLSRNDPPVYPCAECTASATKVCGLCYQGLPTAGQRVPTSARTYVLVYGCELV